ncbi:vacuolar protein sorting-associated protein 16 homolog [Watersipora subatra]|uniref:vacuolar protein sorting-associated protein 16 homolog n=1 Tax=Watersipora subatra TaxID=2589382 RepID=UPI00355B1DC9
MTEFMTSEWSSLGDVFFRKFELYRMTWVDHMNISEYYVAGAPCGGPIAVMKKPMYNSRSDGKQIVSMYNAAGSVLHQFKWQEGGQLIKLGWSASEKLICVQDNGLVIMYDLFGQVDSTFDMGQEASDLKIADCRIFPSFYDTGIIVMTTAYRFWIRSDVNKGTAARKLADIPGMGAPPSCWSAVAMNGNMCALVAKDSQLYLIDQLGQCLLQDIRITDPNVVSYTEIAVSMNGKYVALFTATGLLWMGSADLQRCFCEYNTRKSNRPTQLSWCGSEAVLLYWEGEDVIVVRPQSDSITFPYDTSVCIIPEIDGARIVSNDLHELVQRVPDVTAKIFQIGSMEPGYYLFEAERKYKQQNKEANDYIECIADQMLLAVEQCIEAAGHEYEPSKQKDLLQAGAFGKCFTKTRSPDQFYDMCKTLRVLNAVRDYTIGLPLTHKQLEYLTVELLIERLVYRRQYLLARKICQYLKLKDVENKILAHWACYKVEQSKEQDHVIANSILKKLGESSGVSYSEIAMRAIDRGRKDLAIMLLDHDTSAANQIPLLMKIDRYETALKKAIDSGDSNLIYLVIFELKTRLHTIGEFWMEIRKWQPALNLLMKYYETENPHLLEDLYLQEDRHLDVANCRVVSSLEEQEISARKQLLGEAHKKYKEAKDEWAAKITEEEIRLVERQQQFEGQGLSCLHKSLHETMHSLIMSGNMKAAEQMRKEFNVPERRYWWLKVNALAESSNWLELENFSRTKKSSPIGFRPFVEACARWGNHQETAKYLTRIAPDEKVKCLLSIGKIEDAAELAFERHNEDELNLVLQQCTMADRAVFDRIQRLKLQLRTS